MKVFELEDGSLSIEGRIPYRGFGDAGCHHDYSALSISKCSNLPAKFARGLVNYSKVERLWVWCDVFRTAMPYVLSSPVLRVLDILCISRPGRRMPSFDNALELTEFRCNNGLTETDLIAITKAPNLRELGAQYSAISHTVINSILENPNLEALDLECADITDEYAAHLSLSTGLRSLELGSNPITSTGLKAISTMSQLQRLDIWLTDVSASDLELLVSLENLEYLSVGGSENDIERLTGEQIIPILKSIPSLRSVWLDGVSLSAEQNEELNEMYDSFRN